MADAVEVARHRNVEANQLAAVGVEEEDVGLADRDADQIGSPRAAHHGVGDLRVRNQHILDVARQVDDHGLADPERHEPRRRIADGVDHRPRPCLTASAAPAGVGGAAAITTTSAARAAVRTSVVAIVPCSFQDLIAPCFAS